jgi:CHASE3 domain sensor protein
MSPNGTKWPARRKLATGYAVAIAVLIIDLIITCFNLNSMSRAWDALAFSHDLVAGLEDVLSNLRDAETGQRGYLLTGDERYLEPYTRSHAVVATSIDRLRSRLANDGVRQEHLSTVAKATSAKLSELEQTIKLGRESGLDAALAVVRTDRGRTYMDQLRSEIAAMGAQENATRARLKDGLQAARRMTMVTFTLTSLLALVLLIGVHFLSERSREQLHRHAAWLSTRPSPETGMSRLPKKCIGPAPFARARPACLVSASSPSGTNVRRGPSLVAGPRPFHWSGPRRRNEGEDLSQ